MKNSSWLGIQFLSSTRQEPPASSRAIEIDLNYPASASVKSPVKAVCRARHLPAGDSENKKRRKRLLPFRRFYDKF